MSGLVVTETDREWIISGKTYQRRKAIKKINGNWDHTEKVWKLLKTDVACTTAKQVITEIMNADESWDSAEIRREMFMIEHRERLDKLCMDLIPVLKELTLSPVATKTRLHEYDWASKDGTYLYSGPVEDVNAMDKACGICLQSFTANGFTNQIWSFNYD